ncbi:1-phosphatidylinositol 3-phosphate 5-kinase isoform X2 [Zootermopsis nevadensis]|uniref:1-phosphatidylinositol-3-phosphate 5-kinase n=1 Tax=Zootermopsis nevadensis TaxID=136037 RepID=A0A067RBS7_ZOONE|nr:1-phosphatidylinositol 3-phosphate 5-kinase isoform X2 [Zootermopsis nevadensis]KDR20319.1 1-phosphatidylinositol-3-phosphate 5-kinase [Zootermopsis nevadensis]
MDRNLQSPSHLTEFAPLSPEPSQPGVGFLLSKFFKFNKGGPVADFNAPSPTQVFPDTPVKTDWQSSDNLEQRDTVSDDLVTQFPVDVGEGRSLPNVLKRISSLLALKSTELQAYKDTDFKQYWMPDSVSKECYDCGERFTTFRRRHHCRVCGQIFCSRCCNQEIPGKIMGCTGDLRVCTYCCKVVLSYLQSSDMGADLSADLRALQEDLQTKFGNTAPSLASLSQGSTSSTCGNIAECQDNSSGTSRRKLSLNIQEDRFVLGRAQGSNYMSMEERCRVLQKSSSLRALFEDICHPNMGMTLQTHRYHLRNYHNCFLGSELVDWLLTQSHAATRIQGTAIGQTLIEAGYLDCIGEQNFLDAYALYRPRQVLSPLQYSSPTSPIEDNGRISHEAQEPLWVKQIPQQDSVTTDSESDCQLSEHDETLSLPSSSSSFYLDLNVAENSVHISRPVAVKQDQHQTDSEPGEVKSPARNKQLLESSHTYGISSEFLSGTLLLQNSQSRESVPTSGWHNVTQLRTYNGEQQAYLQLSNGFKQHMHNLLKQLLNLEGLSQSWIDIVVPLAQQIVDTVRPDVRNDADDMDIRQYVQFKKVPGGSRNESCIVNGVVCSKNVAHRAMSTELVSPRILLLGCSIVYQRIEGRLLSLEPVIMQEREYLRHVVARIANLQPDLVLVHRNVSRLAQEFLLALRVTLVLNVKASVLERVARCTQADIVTSVDAHIGRPLLGTCKRFYLKTFQNEKGSSKTLMFFEGCSLQHLGCSVLLHGATNSELTKLKRVVSHIVFTQYSWRLEKSFLMDEFAMPPSPLHDSFFEEPITNGSSQDDLISSPSKAKLCLKNGSAKVLSTCEILHKSCENVAKDSMLYIHLLSHDNKESADIAVVNRENVINNVADVPVSYALPRNTGDINTKDENIQSLSKSNVLSISNVQLNKNVQSENSSTADKMIHLCNKAEHIIASQCADCNKTLQNENRKNVDFVVSDNMNIMYSSALPSKKDKCICEPVHKLKGVQDNVKEVLVNETYRDNCDANKTQPLRIGNKEKSLSEEKRMNVESVSDFSDPLHLYLNLEDEVFHAGNQSTSCGQWLSVAELPLSNRFRKALDDTILSSSPYLKFTVPYLETEPGRNCVLRKFFPDEIFWSAQFGTLAGGGSSSSARAIASGEVNDVLSQEGDSKFKEIKLRPQHPFVSAKLTSTVESCEVQTLLAHFRACGGRVTSTPTSPELLHSTKAPTQGCSTTGDAVNTSAVSKQSSWPDALDPANHQRLAVLFCSYSHESQNAPAFCVSPWVVFMNFYGHNDIPLGSFLERYCFRPSYVCPSESCETPMVHHVRRFVHDMGCVHIILKELEKQIPDTEGNDIVMWSWCSKCRMVSPVVPMSADTWSLSFAKYLELRFHGGMYRRRGQEGTVCSHSLHHEHYQYFGMRNIVASFKYTSITLWEVSLPPPVIATYYDPQQQTNVIEEIKFLALKGYEVYSCILEKICFFGTDLDGIGFMKQQLQKEQVHFKSCIEEIQLKLTSPTLEAKKLEGQIAEKDVQQLMWRIEDSVVQLKRLIADVVVTWNAKIQDLVLISKKRDEKHRRNYGGKPSAPTTSHSLEYDRVSSSSTQLLDDVVVEMASGVTSAAQWEDTSSCSEGHEDTSPSSPEPMGGVAELLDADESLSSGQGLDTSSSALADSINATDSHLSAFQQDAVSNQDSISVQNPEVVLGSQSQTVASGLSRGHVRSYSDVTPTVVDEQDSRQAQHTDKKSVKTILSHLLPTSTGMAPVQSPLSPQEHHFFPTGCSVPVIVYENEPSSIIAYALSSQEYQRSLDDILAKRLTTYEQTSPSPVHKRKSGQSQVEREISGCAEPVQLSESRRSGVLSFLRGSNTANSLPRSGLLDGVQYSTSPAADTVGSPASESDDTTGGNMKGSRTQPHIEVQFSDSSSNFFCRVFFIEQFAALRLMVLPTGEEGFVRSLTRCVQWAARGGKSGSTFCKTRDDRFILKEMSRLEMQLFLEFAPNYFNYIQRCHTSQQPTLLGKIVGVYRIVYRNLTSNATLRSNLLVMENLFYSRSVTHKFDLKGSVRNRLVNPTAADRDGEIVLLDENLLNMTCDDPLYILPHSKTVLTQAISNDTQFLASQSVMDYSLLVGLDKERRELVVGIIDYIRTFTWDKKLETMVKSSGILGGQGKLPTVVSPELYRARFIAAMHQYFLPVPDRWTGLGKGLDC